MPQRISSPLFVGRSAELAAFERLLEYAMRGDGGTLLVAGEAGMGKSRLVSEFEQRARNADALTLIGECVDLAEGELAFAPIVAALRPVMEDGNAPSELQPPLRATLAALWPSLGEAAPASREQLFEGVYRVLARLTRSQTIVLVVEDLHWIDRSSRDLLAFLVRNARRDRLAVVATYRPDELHRGHPLRPFLAELERSGRAQRLELEPLGRTELADQLGAIAGDRPPARLVEEILARSEGNPFFAEELLASPETDELPGSLREALLLRVEALSPATQDLLRAAAIVGRSVDYRLLGQISRAEESALLAALRDATENHVLVPVGHGTAYTFRHALLREAIYDDTFPAERLQLHRAIAEILSAEPQLAITSAAAELAYHWHVAGDTPAALKACLQAAAEAEGMYAYEESLRHVERALSMWDQVEAPEEITGKDRFEMLFYASHVASLAGDAERTLAFGEQARHAVDEREDPLRAAAAEMQIGRALWGVGRGDDAIEHLQQASRLVPADPPSIERAEALAAEGRFLMLTGRYFESLERLEEARQLAAPLDAPAVTASALNSLAGVYSRFGRFEDAIVSGREGLRIATEHQLPEETLRGFVNGSQALDDAGRMDEALALGREGIETARRLGMERHTGDQLRVQAAWRLARQGRYAEAERVLAPAVEAASLDFTVSATKSIAGHLAAQRGAFDVAERLLEEGWELMQRSGGFQLIGPNLAWTTSLYISRGQLDKARARVSDGLTRMAAKEPDLIYHAELYPLAVRIEAESDHRDPARARTVLTAMDEAIASYPGDGAPPEALAFRKLAQAELTRVEKAPEPERWREAGEAFRALGQRQRVAYTDFRAAEALAQTGAPLEQVAEPLRAAHATAVELGSRPLQAAVEQYAKQISVPLGEQRAPRQGPRAERMLATVLFTDIVGSTALAAQLGDRAWKQLLDRHDETVRDELKRHGGTMVQFVGDGTLSTFDSPARALDCAQALRDAVKPLGIEVRAGAHTGEIELRGEDIGGIAVHIGARVAARAGASEILVSQTVADLVTGSGIQFEPRGDYELKGVPGRWRLYAVRGSPAPSGS
jgi:class 3 adenylate cyclase